MRSGNISGPFSTYRSVTVTVFQRFTIFFDIIVLDLCFDLIKFLLSFDTIHVSSISFVDGTMERGKLRKYSAKCTRTKRRYYNISILLIVDHEGQTKIYCQKFQWPVCLVVLVIYANISHLLNWPFTTTMRLEEKRIQG